VRHRRREFTPLSTGNSKNPEASRGKPAWKRFGGPVLALVLVCIAGILIYRTLSQYAFADIVESVRSVPASRLMLAGAFAAGSYFCLTWFDYFGVRYAGHALPYHRVALASFSALSLGHNIGFAALSSGAIRYRFYSRWGLGTQEIAKTILFCGITVGIGLATLGGISLLLSPSLASEITGLGSGAVIGLGIACLAIPASYLALAATVRGSLRLRSWTVELPGPRLAVIQIAIGSINFALVAACLHQAILGLAEVDYLSVASVYVTANVATLVSHVPGGLGVIEAVVVHLLPHAQLIGAVLVFRFAYFLAPLVIGGAVFGISELALRSSPRPSSARAV
jgi:glycosyltransferase 2 family protein